MKEKRYERSGSPRSNGAMFNCVDYVELYVGNAYQSAHFFRTAFGFRPTAYAGLETNVRDRVSFVLEQHNVRLVLTSPLSPSGPIADHVKLHGDGIKDIAFSVDDAEQAFSESVKRGAAPVMGPRVFENERARMVKATIAAYGDTVHSFIQREKKNGTVFPDFQPIDCAPADRHAGLRAIDHIAVTVERGKLDHWVDFYQHVLGFHQSHQEDVATDYSGMNSKVVQYRMGPIRFPIVEPAEGKRKSQLDEYLTYYQGPGVQHLAMLTDDIVSAVRTLRANGIEFLRTPATYYDALEARVGAIEEDVDLLKEQSILVDRDEWGYLMQIFSKPIHSRPTLFLEVIQRKGARGFGGGNIKALFEAVEREQALRGNL